MFGEPLCPTNVQQVINFVNFIDCYTSSIENALKCLEQDFVGGRFWWKNDGHGIQSWTGLVRKKLVDHRTQDHLRQMRSDENKLTIHTTIKQQN